MQANIADLSLLFQEAYIRGVSGWNFDVAALRRSATEEGAPGLERLSTIPESAGTRCLDVMTALVLSMQPTVIFRSTVAMLAFQLHRPYNKNVLMSSVLILRKHCVPQSTPGDLLLESGCYFQFQVLKDKIGTEPVPHAPNTTI